MLQINWLPFEQRAEIYKAHSDIIVTTVMSTQLIDSLTLHHQRMGIFTREIFHVVQVCGGMASNSNTLYAPFNVPTFRTHVHMYCL